MVSCSAGRQHAVGVVCPCIVGMCWGKSGPLCGSARAVGREVPPAAPPAAITCLLIKNSARVVCAAVLKGIDDLKVKGFRHDQMQVRPSTLRHSGQVAGRLVCAVPFRLPARPA